MATTALAQYLGHGIVRHLDLQNALLALRSGEPLDPGGLRCIGLFGASVKGVKISTVGWLCDVPDFCS